MKTCNRCGDEKPLDAFPKHPDASDGHQQPCKACRSEYNKQRRKTIDRGDVGVSELMMGWPRG